MLITAIKTIFRAITKLFQVNALLVIRVTLEFAIPKLTVAIILITAIIAVWRSIAMPTGVFEALNIVVTEKARAFNSSCVRLNAVK